MVVLEKSPKVVSSEFQAELHVDRKDITFESIDANTVRIQVTVQNIGTAPSAPTTIRLESAPFGAFVPWQPLATLTVPALKPGESRKLTTEVGRPHPKPLGQFDRVPPKNLITAVNTPDQPAPQAGAGVLSLLSLFRRAATGSKGSLAKGQALAPDLLDLLGRGQPYWAGNINVFVGNRSVERHLAKALRIYPGRTNLAMFMVGSQGKHDAYAFELEGLAPDWNAALYDVGNQRNLVINPNEVPIRETQWIETTGGMVVMLATRPPADCRKGNLEVQVRRRSTGMTAIVEFDLDPAAQGSGCYCV